MKLFIDTANVEHIREFAEIGVISGVTTNPTLIAKEGRDFNEVISRYFYKYFLLLLSFPLHNLQQHLGLCGTYLNILLPEDSY